MQYAYPTYDIDLQAGLMQQCVDIAPRILHEVGLYAPNDRFLAHFQGKAGLRIENQRVYFDPDLSRKFIREFIEQAKADAEVLPESTEPATEWRIETAGYSMMTIDVETEELREGTSQDLRDMIRLSDSFGVGGDYMIMPQDVSPLMRTLACFKICWEMSDKVRPYDYQQPEQLPYLYEMHQVVGKTMDIRLTIPAAMTLDPNDLDIFLDFYPQWKQGGDFRFCIGNYTMLGIMKPISAPGCATMMFCEELGVKLLLQLFDPEIDILPRLNAGHPTDLRSANWAFGSPRAHIFSYLNSRIKPNLIGLTPQAYKLDTVQLATSSPAIDTLAGMEKMAGALHGALLGARTFTYAGTLCVDDVYSGTQFVIDTEIINYIRELVESYNPHPDIVAVAGLYDEIVDVALGRELFLSHPNTVRRFRNVLPSSNLIVREKLRVWMGHHKILKDRAREVARERIQHHRPAFSLPDDQQAALDRIYTEAERNLGGKANVKTRKR